MTINRRKFLGNSLVAASGVMLSGRGKGEETPCEGHRMDELG